MSVGAVAQHALAAASEAGAQHAPDVSSTREGVQQPVAAAAVATSAATVVSQHAGAKVPAIGVDEHTPVGGKVSSTRRADSQSPARAATTERTCSYPVSMRKVGARP